MRRRDDNAPLCSRRYWTARGVVPRYQLLLVYLLVIVISVTGFIRIGNQASSAERIAKENAHLVLVTNQLARQTAELTRRLQAQRLDNIRRACEDQNFRHDRTLDKLDRVLRAAVQDPVARLRIRAQNALLINALAPHQNCDKLVREATRTP